MSGLAGAGKQALLNPPASARPKAAELGCRFIDAERQ
jgi:hypothetical protein